MTRVIYTKLEASSTFFIIFNLIFLTTKGLTASTKGIDYYEKSVKIVMKSEKGSTFITRDHMLSNS